jgi:hypothetical protein
MKSRRAQTVSRGRTIVIWSIAAVLIVVTFVAVWVAVRALMARDELLGAVPLASRIGSQALEGGDILPADLGELQDRASSAASLTSDPIWRAVEWVPLLGNNLTAFREAASMIDTLATNALPPLQELAGTFTIDSLSPAGGAFDLDSFVSAQPMIAETLSALESADARASSIDTQNTIPQIGIALDEVVRLVSDARSAVQSVDTAVTLLPSMLGADGPREYLLMSLNNAELRATGGIAGALAVIKADEGRIELGALTTATELGEFDAPVLELTESERVLYGDLIGTYMQDVNYTPDFARSGALARSMWLERTGTEVDGVIAIDPIALGYILRATGPIDAGSGLTLSSDNARDLLLNGVYTSFPEPRDQDQFFASAMSRIFGSLVGGDADPITLLNSLAEGVEENRIHLWSADPAEQDRIVTTPMAGVVPISDERTTGFGVYFNDATGGKMDYYLSSGIGIASAVCRNDERPNFEVTIKLESRAPEDAAISLPPYVTGAGAFGVEPGHISTSVFVYAPSGSVPYSVTIDGHEHAFVDASDGAHSIAGVTVELVPGQQSELSMKFVGIAGAPAAVELQHTPMASDVLTSVDNYLDCSEIAPPPVEGEEGQSGALGGAGIGNFSELGLSNG